MIIIGSEEMQCNGVGGEFLGAVMAFIENEILFILF